MFIRRVKQFFAPDGAGTGTIDSVGGLNSFFNSVGEEGQTTQPTQETPATNQQVEEPQTEEPPAQQEEQAQQQQQVPSEPNKQNYAFGQMRTQIKTYEDMFAKIAKANGIEYKDTQELLTKLNDQALQNLSKRDNVPVELLQRLELLEQNNQLYEQEKLKQSALIGFQKLQDSYGLNQEELIRFAGELDAQGINPFTQQVDLEERYKVMHFDSIVERKIKEAVQTALKQTTVADTHSTSPNNAQGRQGEGGEKKVSTVSELTNALSGINIK